MTSHRIPSDIVVEIILHYFRQLDRNDDFAQVPTLAARAGILEDTLHKILKGRSSTISFALADKLITAMGFNLMWWTHPRLSQHYFPEGRPPDLTKPCKCKNPTCISGGWFEVPEWDGPNATATKHQRFCTKACQQQYNRVKRGEQIDPREREVKCVKGHPYDEHGVYIDPAGHVVCRECRRQAKRRYDAQPHVRERKARALRQRRASRRAVMA